MNIIPFMEYEKRYDQHKSVSVTAALKYFEFLVSGTELKLPTPEKTKTFNFRNLFSPQY